MSTHVKVPINITSFREIIEGNYAYVDKTALIAKLIRGESYVNLPRPPKFGKTLLCDTIACIFRGEKELFEGLAISETYDFSKTYPVLYLDMSQAVPDDPDQAEEAFNKVLTKSANFEEFTTEYDKYASILFSHVLHHLHDTHGERVVILVDNYDEPYLKFVDDQEAYDKVRRVYDDAYITVKSHGSIIEFCMFTGQSRYRCNTIFSGLNNLFDLSFYRPMGALSSFTEEDLHQTFDDVLDENDFKNIRSWYYGYSFDGEVFTYPPYEILQYLAHDKKLDSYWYPSKTSVWEPLKEVATTKRALDAVGSQFSWSFLLGETEKDSIPMLNQGGYIVIGDCYKSYGECSYAIRYPNHANYVAMLSALAPVTFTIEKGKEASGLETLKKGLLNHNAEEIKAGIAENLTAVTFIDYEPKNTSFNLTVFQYLLYQQLSKWEEVRVTCEEWVPKWRINLVIRGESFTYLIEIESAVPSPYSFGEKYTASDYGDLYQERGVPVYIVKLAYHVDKQMLEEVSLEKWEKQAEAEDAEAPPKES